jgi:retron-type reverse transcriptase
VSKGKPFSISKEKVQAAYKQIKANKGAAGVDRQTIANFEIKLEDNLYKLWNRNWKNTFTPTPTATTRANRQ